MWEEARMGRIVMTGLAAALAAAGGVPAVAQDKPQLAPVVNAASDSWKLAEAG